MSLINQMLKDLDARHDAGTRARLHREVRPLPAANDNRGLRLAVAALTVLALLASIWWAYPRLIAEYRSVPPVTVAADVPAAPAALSAPVAAPPVAEAVAPAAVSPAAAETVSVADAMLDGSSGLKMSAMLDRVPATLPVEPRPARTLPRRDAQATPPAAATGERMAKAETSAKPMAPVVEKQLPSGKGGREQSEADYRRAMTLVNGARVQEATDLLLDVLSRDGNHTASRQLLARLLIEQRRFDEAYAILAEGLALQPGQVGWAMTLARLQVERSDLAGAARTLQASQQYAAGNADYLGFAAHVQQRLGQHKAAVELYQGAIRVAPGEGRWWLGLGLALESDQRAAEAREAFLRARATGSLNPDLQALVDQKLR